MAKSIAASVGRMGGINPPADVRTVQELLNKVPEADGGPRVMLAVDGVCSNGTCDGIQCFQMRHFGMSGADGRVDPAGPTLKKLNEYDTPAPPVAKPVGTIKAFIGNVVVQDFVTGAERPASVGMALTNQSGVLLRGEGDFVTIQLTGGIETFFSGRGAINFFV